MTPGWEPPGLLRALGRAMRRRCPRCGQQGIFATWFTLHPTCPGCALRFEREEGYWTGSVAINLAVTEGLFLGVLVLGVVATWPEVPWTRLLVILVAVTVAVPVIFHPFARTLWVAVERRARHWKEPGGP